MDASGRKIGNNAYDPTSEVTLHIRMYRKSPENRALIHAQPPFSTAYAIKNIPINNCVLPENYVYLGVVPKGAYNKTTGEISAELKECLKTKKGFLYEGTSVFSTGDTLENAFDNVDSLEFYSKMNFIGGYIPCGTSVAEAASAPSDSEAVVKTVTQQIMRELGM